MLFVDRELNINTVKLIEHPEIVICVFSSNRKITYRSTTNFLQ